MPVGSVRQHLPDSMQTRVRQHCWLSRRGAQATPRTVLAYGISSWYSMKIFSRMISPTKKRSGCSLTLSCVPAPSAAMTQCSFGSTACVCRWGTWIPQCANVGQEAFPGQPTQHSDTTTTCCCKGMTYLHASALCLHASALCSYACGQQASSRARTLG